jgi:hypothetical protein
MIDQETLQQEFFIYVPNVSVSDRSTDAHVESTLCADALPGWDEWIKIPLTEELVVYARMSSEDQSVVSC